MRHGYVFPRQPCPLEPAHKGSDCAFETYMHCADMAQCDDETESSVAVRRLGEKAIDAADQGVADLLGDPQGWCRFVPAHWQPGAWLKAFHAAYKEEWANLSLHITVFNDEDDWERMACGKAIRQGYMGRSDMQAHIERESGRRAPIEDKPFIINGKPYENPVAQYREEMKMLSGALAEGMWLLIRPDVDERRWVAFIVDKYLNAYPPQVLSNVPRGYGISPPQAAREAMKNARTPPEWRVNIEQLNMFGY